MPNVSSIDLSTGSGAASEGDRRPAAVLPPSLTPLFGREAEISKIVTLLDGDETRLLTLMGPGGVGKTRLAVEVSRTIEPDFADGICFMALASVRDPDLVLPAIAQALGVQERAERQLQDLVATALRDKHMLLVLDNFEHLLTKAPTWLPYLLGACSRITVLVTSRTALNISGEHRYLVPPLAIPQSQGNADPMSNEAVALFAHRAKAIRSDFVVDTSNGGTIEEICRQLDGLPLAIELVAARINALTPAEILSRLTHRFRLLTGGQRDAPVRLQTLWDAIAWSYDLLTPDEQIMFQGLSVFVGGFTLESVEKVVGTPLLDAVNGISSLVDNSLLRMVADKSDPRFLMLETIREFGLEKLAANGDTVEVRNRHADWCVSLASKSVAGQDLVWRPNLAATNRLVPEQGNLRAALTWLDDMGRREELTLLVIQLRWFWYLCAMLEGLSWFERIVALHGPSEQAYSDALRLAGWLAQALDSPKAGRYLDEALSLARASGDVHREAEALFFRAVIAEDAGQYRYAESYFGLSRELYLHASDDWARIVADYHLGVVTYGYGDFTKAAVMLEGARSAAMAIDDDFVPAWATTYLAVISCELGEPDHAAAVLRRQPAVLGLALQHQRSSALATVGVLAATVTEYASAARLFGAAASDPVPNTLPERATFERFAERARHQLGDDAFNREWKRGNRMRQSELTNEIERLLSGTDAQLRHAHPTASVDTGLSTRELEVLRLLADGLSNQEIADELFISVRTITSHTTSILAKLNLRSRTSAVAYAIRNGLA